MSYVYYLVTNTLVYVCLKSYFFILFEIWMECRHFTTLLFNDIFIVAAVANIESGMSILNSN